ncbi:hypothetical protein ECEC1735_4414, partial [Escherichia coli EC1735]|jgi:hypothetical protein
MNVS